MSTGVGFINTAFSTRFLKISLHVICKSYYLLKPYLITQDRLEIYPFFILKHFFQKLFPSLVIEWNNLDESIRNSESLSIFKKSIQKF